MVGVQPTVVGMSALRRATNSNLGRRQGLGHGLSRARHQTEQNIEYLFSSKTKTADSEHEACFYI